MLHRLSNRFIITLCFALLLPAADSAAQHYDNLPCSSRRDRDSCFAECTGENWLLECTCLWADAYEGFFDCPEGETCCFNMPCQRMTDIGGFECLRLGGSPDGITPKHCGWTPHDGGGVCACVPPLVPSGYTLEALSVANSIKDFIPPFDCTCPFTTDEQWLRLGVCNPPTVRKLEVKLNFAKPQNDTVSFEGSLSIPENFIVAGATLNANIGGVIRTFTLDSRGKGRSNNDQAQLTVKSSHGVVLAQQAKLSLKFSKGTFGAQFADDGLVNQNVTNALVSLPIEIELEGTMFAKTHALKYTAKAGKTGSAK